MSVPKNKRTLSKFEVYEQAVKFRAIMTNLILKDFGIKDRIKDIRFVSKNMPTELNAQIESLLNLYQEEHKVILNYPTWFVEKERDVVNDLLVDLVHSIVQANKIYISNRSEYEERRLLIDKAIYTCHSLLVELRFIADTLHIPLSKMENYIKMLDTEINYLKGWRQADNKLLKNI